MKYTRQHLQDGQPYLVGIDLGPSSVGWAVIACDDKGNPLGLVASGVRRFEAGVLGDIEKGKDESRATARRDARGPRRQNFRRRRRMKKLFNLLCRNGLLPPCEAAKNDQRHEHLLAVDQKLREELGLGGDRVSDQLLPYELRKRALDEKLPLHAVGRALYQLAQRRGFLSNRKAGGDEEETGKVKSGIADLYKLMDKADVPTIGSYFTTLDPEEQRIRSRWTSRHMFWEEFEAIWNAQAEHHKELTDELKEEIHAAIFFQRPLKSQKHLIGRCSIDPTKRRAPAACLPFQEFRVLQRVNDLRVTAPDGEIVDLTEEQKQQLATELLQTDGLSWAAIKKLLGMKKSKDYGRHWEFNFEKAGDKKLIGNRTYAKLEDALGESWTELSANDQDILVDEILQFDNEQALANRLETELGIPADRAKAAAGAKLEDAYAAYSRHTIERYLLKLREGFALQTIRRELDPETFATIEPLDELPPVRPTGYHKEGAFPELRNPAVERAMSEFRKVINAILKKAKHKPWAFRVEMARDLKHSRKRRQDLTDRRNQNTKSREEAYEKILREMGHENYCTRDNVLKVRLAEECGWVCPFSGKSINMKQLVGNESQFQIEHIIPFSRSLDNSFTNKTLCYHEENARKGNRMPWEAYHGTDYWDEMIARVKRCRGDSRGIKLQRFLAEELPEQDEFTKKQLS
ncbi:MAG: type II CRISPR RNA-guided endonuclease Cas9, partial [Lacipirellulaceae bacterium]